ncbi:unnamed protein product [Rhizophagus irregularis]|uniref:Uncharacterized protein n=1 Tax=Rhizophagus irregularis TaxID=588596 RepID=A0A916E9R5_9GLOM|nr:unnamed protein product [Rhizophagus irregularis]CAB5188644.1 unnamed protein product [Rhizophagus irregularis]CAB5365512.1 unnamed protein product [Rhizophagus irregularis]
MKKSDSKRLNCLNKAHLFLLFFVMLQAFLSPNMVHFYGRRQHERNLLIFPILFRFSFLKYYYFPLYYSC